MKTEGRRTYPLALLIAAITCAGGGLQYAKAAFALTASDCGISVVRVYFSNRLEAAKLFVGFEGIIRETNYSGHYHVMAVTTEQRAQLAQAGYRIADEPTAVSSGARGVQASGTTAAAPFAAADASPALASSCYRTVEETFATARQIVASHPTLATWVDIGNSWVKAHGGSATDPTLPGDDIMTLVLTNSAVAGNKPKLFIVSSIHANEIAPAELSTRFAEYLIGHHGIDADATWILDHNEIHLLLIPNPDSRRLNDGDRGLRKNRNNTEWGSVCTPNPDYIGVDLNRNFPYKWHQCEANCRLSTEPCDPGYIGSGAESEPETQAVVNRLQQLFPAGDRTGVFLDLHAYSELVLWPWGYTGNPSPDDKPLATLGRKLAHYNNYAANSSFLGLYGTAGTTTDFAYGALGVPAFEFELGTQYREDCAYFESDILPKNLNALIYAAKVARSPYQTPAGPGTTSLALSKSVIFDTSAVALTAAVDDRQFGVYGIETAQRIAAAEYYIDVPPWASGARAVAMAATDGVFGCRDDAACATHATEAESLAAEIRAAADNEKLTSDPCKAPGQGPVGAADPNWYIEKCQAYSDALTILQEPVAATIPTSQLSLGRHTVYVRGRDSDGNWGPVSAAFLTKAARGDVNADGRVDIVDALLVAQAYVNANPPGFYADGADVNCSGNADIVDALLIAQYYVGIIAALPTCRG